LIAICGVAAALPDAGCCVDPEPPAGVPLEVGMKSAACGFNITLPPPLGDAFGYPPFDLLESSASEAPPPPFFRC